MKANVGDWLVIKGTTTERSDQRGLITEVHWSSFRANHRLQQRDRRGHAQHDQHQHQQEPARALPDPPTAPGPPHPKRADECADTTEEQNQRRTDRQRISLQASAMGQWVGTAAGLAAADPPQRKA